MRRLTNSLVGRIVAGMMLAHLFMIPLLFGGVLYMIQKDYEAQFVDHARSDAYQFAKILSQVSQIIDIPEKLDDALLSGRVAYADYIKPDGQSAFSISTETGKKNIKEDFYFGQNNDKIYFIKVPLNKANGILGELHLGYDEGATRNIIEKTYRRGIYIAILYITITFIIMVLIGRQLTRPLKKLERLSHKIADGHYEGPLEVESNILEVKHLSEALGFMRDQLLKKTNAMEHQALHDALTGLPNRALLHDRIDQALLPSRGKNNSFALLLLDLDHFKEINDSLGHQAGDMVLINVANQLLSCIRQSDTVARLGGDEFAILLPTSNQEIAKKTAAMTIDRLKEPCTIGESELHVDASIGIAMYPEHSDTFEGLLRCADAAMYAAKADHMGAVIYHAGLDKKKVYQLSMATELRSALEHKELALYFQPKMQLDTNTLCGVETLTRWERTNLESIPPDVFIPLAERTGLIHPLTQWVLNEAISQGGKWYEAGYPLSIAVNLSAHNLRDHKLPATISNLLDQHGLPASFLTIEITESAIFSDPLKAQTIFKRLHDMGVELAIDDFGTGYSSLYQLRNLPVSQLKIDKSFITDMHENKNDEAIVKATINMAHDLNLSIVAEGVEDVKTLNTLKALGCNQAQGFYFSKPLPLREFERNFMHYEQQGSSANHSGLAGGSI